MTCGVGAFGLAGFAAVFIAAFLFLVGWMGQNSPRVMELEIVTDSPSFPASQIEKVLSARTVSFELHEMAVTKETTADYVVNIRDHAELKTLSDELMHADGGAVRSVTWSEKKWMRQ